MLQKRVLVIDDEENILVSLRGVLEDEGFAVETSREGVDGLAKLKSFRPEVVLLDIWMPGEDGIRVLEKIRKADLGAEVIMMSGHGSVETAVKTIKLGAFDFLEKPIHFDKLQLLLEHAFDLRSLEYENRSLRQALESEVALVGQSPAMERLRSLILLAAPSNGWVLIQGENGTGKELVARALHLGSTRSVGRFVAVNCAAVPDELIESELFGHERGSFTGAFDRKIGKFEQAHGGTLFLDEVGDMGPKMQAKILRALQESSIQRVGGDRPIDVDIRVIAATNKDLKRAIRAGEFREDLYYRLNVIPISIPPLRERKEDIFALMGHFLGQYSKGQSRRVSSRVMKLLCSYLWPGNVRELKNWVERGCILSTSLELDSWDLESGLETDPFELGEVSLRKARTAFERKFIMRVLSENGGNITRTAQKIGVERSHLHKKLKSYGIDVNGGAG